VRIEMFRVEGLSGEYLVFYEGREALMEWHVWDCHMAIFPRFLEALPFLIDFVSETDLPRKKILLTNLLEAA
jgi:hypothetical protein